MTSQNYEQSTIEAEIRYWLRREREERDAASAAKDKSAREAHLALAKRYAERAHIMGEHNANAMGIQSCLWPKNGGWATTI